MPMLGRLMIPFQSSIRDFYNFWITHLERWQVVDTKQQLSIISQHASSRLQKREQIARASINHRHFRPSSHVLCLRELGMFGNYRKSILLFGNTIGYHEFPTSKKSFVLLLFACVTWFHSRKRFYKKYVDILSKVKSINSVSLNYKLSWYKHVQAQHDAQ